MIRWWFYGLSEICLFATITTRSRRNMFFTATWSLLIFSFPRAGLHWMGTRETERQSGRGNHEWRSMEVTWWQVNVADSVGLVNVKPICEESQDGGLWNCEGRLAGHGVPSNLHGFCLLVCFSVRCWPVQLQWQRRKLVRLDSPIFAFLGRIECIVMLVSFQKGWKSIGAHAWMRPYYLSPELCQEKHVSQFHLSCVSLLHGLCWSKYKAAVPPCLNLELILSFNKWLIGHRGVYQEMHWCGNWVVCPVQSWLKTIWWQFEIGPLDAKLVVIVCTFEEGLWRLLVRNMCSDSVAG